MKITIGNIIKLSIRHTFHRNDTVYYQRKIPKDLIERFGTKLIKENLKTTNTLEIASKVERLNKHYENLWAAMRKDNNITPSSVRLEAIALLKRFDLKPCPALNDEMNLEHFFDIVVESKRVKYARGDEDLYRTSSPYEYLSNVEAEALKLTIHKPKLLLSESLEIYLSGHSNRDKADFIAYIQRSLNKLISILGDIPFEDVSRANANYFVEKLLESGVKTTTIKRNLNDIKAIFNVVIAERELHKPNPFHKLRIAGLGNDVKVRQPFNKMELDAIGKACLIKNDDLRWLIALQMDSGCRIAEIVGLALDDINLGVDIPYISIRPHTWRGLKTSNSKRDIPLVGMSLWAARQIIDNSTNEQLFAFPRYNDGVICKATSASKTANDWIKAQGIETTTHGFRHAMRDRLRNSNAPEEIQDAVGGWSKNKIGAGYGKGYALKTLKYWLDKVIE